MAEGSNGIKKDDMGIMFKSISTLGQTVFVNKNRVLAFPIYG